MGPSSGGMTGERVNCERGPRARLPFDPREARELGEVLVPAVLHDEVAEEGMVAAELRRAGTCARRCNGEERSGRRAEQIYSPPPCGGERRGAVRRRFLGELRKNNRPTKIQTLPHLRHRRRGQRQRQ